MKFKNRETGVVLEPNSELVQEQLAKDERFEQVEGKPAPAADTGTGQEKPLEKMNKAELMAAAAACGAQIAEGATNAAIIEAIKAVQQ